MLSKSAQVEQLADAIARDIYLDVANWHLYLGDAKLAIALAEKFFLNGSDNINQSQLNELLAEFRIKIGGGKQEIPLVDLIPDRQLQKLLEIVQNCLADH